MSETVLMTAGDFVRHLRNMGASEPLIFPGNPTHAEMESTPEGVRVVLVGAVPEPAPEHKADDAEA